LPFNKKSSLYKSIFFCLEIQLWFLETDFFLKFELEKFGFSIFWRSKKEIVGSWKKNLLGGIVPIRENSSATV
jgi:hypothetical protein